jgi:hypothetical protein
VLCSRDQVALSRGGRSETASVEVVLGGLGAAVSILSLLVAGFSLIYVRRSAKASREQTK